MEFYFRVKLIGALIVVPCEISVNANLNQFIIVYSDIPNNINKVSFIGFIVQLFSYNSIYVYRSCFSFIVYLNLATYMSVLSCLS